MADNELVVSKYADGLEHVDSGRKISSDPKTWVCEDSGKTDNLWLNLSTGEKRRLPLPTGLPHVTRRAGTDNRVPRSVESWR